MIFLHRSYATINELFFDLTGIWFGLPVYSFGFFVGLALFVGAIVIYLDLKRKAKTNQLPAFREDTRFQPTMLIFYLAIGFFAGFKLFGLFANLNEPLAYWLSARGSFIGGVIGLLAAVGYMLFLRKRKAGENDIETLYPHQVIGEMTVLAGVFGVIGAKLFFFLEEPGSFRLFLEDPIMSLFSGLTVYGGLITGGIAVFFYTRKRNIPFLKLADSSAPGLMLGYGIGRIGCHVSGDGDWGIVNPYEKPSLLGFLPDWLWAHDYPHNIINAGVPIEGCTEAHCFVLPETVYPTPIYELLAACLLFGVLWHYRKKIIIPGMLFTLYLILSGTQRFLIELIRVNPTYDLALVSLTQAQLISLGLIAAGTAGFVFLRKKAPSPE